jgi:alpha-mannosidase
MLAVAGVEIPAFGSVELAWEPGEPQTGKTPFTFDGDTLTTSFARVRFSQNGALASFVDLRTGRELVDKEGYAFNTFLVAEDLPAAWDNWDVDADLEDKFADTSRLVKREIVSVGQVEGRIRSVYQLTPASTLIQDMVFDAFTPQVSFETVIDWQDGHRFLKAAFDTALLCDGVRNEIQFGFIRRSNHRSTPQEKARFEICNHKYSDLSEAGYGMPSSTTASMASPCGKAPCACRCTRAASVPTIWAIAAAMCAAMRYCLTRGIFPPKR